MVLIGLAGAFTLFAVVDMVIYNRRKRREYYTEQQASLPARMAEASSAVASNTATPEQLALLEHHGQQMRQTESKEGIFSRIKALLFSDLKKDEGGDDIRLEKGQEQLSNEGGNIRSTYETGERESSIMKAIEAKKRSSTGGERVNRQNGGLLDQLGNNTEIRTQTQTAEKDPKAATSSSWTTFFSRRWGTEYTCI